jgi:hypothetical protein
MNVTKSTRHSKITGDFAESLVLYWLSKYGFECASIDRTGIDLIARNPHTKELAGVSVKSRSRIAGRELTSVSIPGDNFDKAATACAAFGCNPYFAIVVDAADLINGFILPMPHLLKLCPRTRLGSYWSMSRASQLAYAADPEIKAFNCVTRTTSWWTPTGAP